MDKKLWDKTEKNHDEFLQSWEWGEFQKKLGRRVWRLKFGELSAQIIKHKLPLINKGYFYIPRGPILKNALQKDWKDFLNHIKILAKEEKAVFLKMEPIGTGPEILKILEEKELKKIAPTQPQKTKVIDLRKSEDELLSDMEAETRYAIRTAQKRNVKIIMPESAREKEKLLRIFYTLFKETAARHKIKILEENYYKGILGFQGSLKAKIFGAELNSEIVAAAIVLFFNRTAYYLFAASKSGFGRYNAPTLIVWEAIKDAKKNNFNFFDFWGLADGSKKSWIGFSKFKESFGGKEFDYGKAFAFIFNKNLYRIYGLVKRIL